MSDFIQRMFAAGLIPTAPQAGSIRISSPFRKRTTEEERDRKWFIEQKGKRRAFIRDAYYQEFDFHTDISEKLHAPPLWVLVTYESPNHIKRVPIYRGTCPYVEEPETDEAVFTIVERCVVLGGIDVASVDKWLQDRAARRGLPHMPNFV